MASTDGAPPTRLHDRGRDRVKASPCPRASYVLCRLSILQFTVEHNYNPTTNLNYTVTTQNTIAKQARVRTKAASKANHH